MKNVSELLIEAIIEEEKRTQAIDNKIMLLSGIITIITSLILFSLNSDFFNFKIISDVCAYRCLFFLFILLIFLILLFVIYTAIIALLIGNIGAKNKIVKKMILNNLILKMDRQQNLVFLGIDYNGLVNFIKQNKENQEPLEQHLLGIITNNRTINDFKARCILIISILLVIGVIFSSAFILIFYSLTF